MSGVFSEGFPDGGVAADRGERRVPRPDRDRKIEGADHCDHTERMPLLHQTMAGPFRLNRQAIKHARLTDREVADIDHLLHFAFAFRDNFSGLERDKLAKLVFQFAKRVAEPANGFAANRAGVVRHFKNASCARRWPCRNRQPEAVRTLASDLSIDWRNLVDLAPPPRHSPAKDAGVFAASGPDFSKTDCIVSCELRTCGLMGASWKLRYLCHSPALFADQRDRFVDDFCR